MNLEWHYGKHAWEKHDDYPRHQHSLNGALTIAPNDTRLHFRGGVPFDPEPESKKAHRMTRLTWAKGQYGTQEGSAGRVRLFTISYRIVSTEPMYELRTDLPGYKSATRWKADTTEELKAQAEKSLDFWLRQTGLIKA